MIARQPGNNAIILLEHFYHVSNCVWQPFDVTIQKAIMKTIDEIGTGNKSFRREGCKLLCYFTIKVTGRLLSFKIIFDGIIIILPNKSIMMHRFTLLSVSEMISGLNDY